MDIIIGGIQTLIKLYVYCFVAHAILSWLIAFNIVNLGNPVISMINDFLHRITLPVLRPIRKVLPDLGGIDISPVLAIVGLYVVAGLLGRLAMQMAFA